MVFFPKIRGYSWRLILSACLVACCVQPKQVWAFSSFEFFGGAYHQEITESALETVGFKYESIVLIGEGVVEFDKFYRDAFEKNCLHFVLESETEPHDELEHAVERIVVRANTCESDYQVYRETLSLVGQYFHTTQDFYSHSNWVERWMSKGIRVIPIADVNSVELVKASVFPHFIPSYFPSGEKLDPAEYEQKFKKKFYSPAELDKLSDRARILETVHPRKAFIHRYMAKDDPDYRQSNLRWEKDGPTVFEAAVDVAVRDTRVRWQHVEARLLERYGVRGQRIVKLLKTGWDSNLPASSQQDEAPEVTLVSGELHVNEALDYEVKIVLRPIQWDQAGARAVTALYTDFTTHLETREHIRGQGIHRLQLRKNPSDKTFTLRASLDLRGGGQTFLTARPVDSENPERGDWQLSWQIPKGFPSLRDIKISSCGGHEGWDGEKLILKAPRQGWILPDWVLD